MDLMTMPELQRAFWILTTLVLLLGIGYFDSVLTVKKVRRELSTLQNQVSPPLLQQGQCSDCSRHLAQTIERDHRIQPCSDIFRPVFHAPADALVRIVL